MHAIRHRLVRADLDIDPKGSRVWRVLPMLQLPSTSGRDEIRGMVTDFAIAGVLALLGSQRMNEDWPPSEVACFGRDGMTVRAYSCDINGPALPEKRSSDRVMASGNDSTKASGFLSRCQHGAV